ncbi:DUF2252 domain-containing protein [Streptomyces sp. WAC06614]|uniref:DUF2252 domain-containing protein n=1 Tax=Streptomyces sp. WAC06614 TaxID=2487416 RepID=UPI000F78B1DC|nr:DUF2252 domain-containing protein [Streptomyces sp. WAC06614]RSS67419.1 DUF2252 domain-containing protein [Streptomyces sp. WAC06614]
MAMLTPAERAAVGRAARQRAPRSAHADFAPDPDRPDPVDVLEQQAAGRLTELLPIRYGRMAESPFRFYRGAAAVMAADLAGTPDSGLRTQLCGDCHMMNFGLFGSPERNLLFDLNDFDETLPGPWEWDVKRLVASLAISGRDNGFCDDERAEIVRGAARSYRETMRYFATQRTLDVWYARVDEDRLRELADQDLRRRGRKALAEALEKARGRDSRQALDKLTELVDGEYRFVSDPPLVTPLSELMPRDEERAFEAMMAELIGQYALTLPSDRRHLLSQFHVVDMARKVVGVGSVGTRCWIVLLLGRDGSDPLVLQAKEAGESVLAPYAGPAEHRNQGERVVAGQRLMQAATDIFLGWTRVNGIDGRQRDFYVRQLRDWKGSTDPAEMVPRGMRTFGEVCAATLARAHARSGDRVAIGAYLGRGEVFDQAMVGFAERYADQNERDHRALLDAIAAGRLTAQSA